MLRSDLLLGLAALGVDAAMPARAFAQTANPAATRIDLHHHYCSPDWLASAGYQASQPRTVSRRYRIIMAGQPVMIITEYFLESFSRTRRRDEPNVSLTFERHGYTESE